MSVCQVLALGQYYMFSAVESYWERTTSCDTLNDHIESLMIRTITLETHARNKAPVLAILTEYIMYVLTL